LSAGLPAHETPPERRATGAWRRPDWLGLAVLTLSAAVGVTLVLLATATFIQMIR
jgi:hypothetical protein